MLTAFLALVFVADETPSELWARMVREHKSVVSAVPADSDVASEETVTILVPSSARLWINDQEMTASQGYGERPFAIPQIQSEGVYHLRVEFNGRTVHRDLDISPGQSYRVDMRGYFTNSRRSLVGSESTPASFVGEGGPVFSSRGGSC